MSSNSFHLARKTRATLLIGGLMVGASMPQAVQAQVPLPRNLPPIQRPDPTIPTQPLPDKPLPPPDDLLNPSGTAPPTTQPGTNITGDIQVDRIEIEGSTVFSAADFAPITKPYLGRKLTFTELLQIRTDITKFYVNKGYITSGAIIPPQTITGGVIKVQVIEGRLESINVSGNKRLRSGYISQRLALGATKPLNVNNLLESLQLLKLDPLITNISADLQAGVKPNSQILQVDVQEAKSFYIAPSLDNARSPSVGSFRRQIQVSEANLLGLGDGLSLGYSNTDGSNGIDLSYSLPINAKNGTLRFSFGNTRSKVLEEPFDALEIKATSRYYELFYRQPVVLKPRTEFSVGFGLSHQTSQTELGLDDIGPFALSLGADENGSTRVTALRFFQEWTNRSEKQVLAARSQFSIGTSGLFGASQNDQGVPDSNFISWRGQAQWVRLLARDSIFLVRGDMQVADRGLLSLEQIGLGGSSTVRGYRQDTNLTDNGALFSAEVRLPILRVKKIGGLLQLAPFFDLATGWNRDRDNPDPRTLASVGTGLIWRQGDSTARLDWGIPLVSTSGGNRSLQEQGLHFSMSTRF
jgi:hemolysin activation/secretion protein